MFIAELKRKPVQELHQIAEGLRLENVEDLHKQELVFTIARRMLADAQELFGTGVLEVMPEGYGFLRSPRHNYLYGPDDIYVSPSQIKRFDLRTGDTVTGKVRPPNGDEGFMALLHVQSVNDGPPGKARSRTGFRHLRPRYPDRRLTLERPGGGLTPRLIDLLAPVGTGQRGLVVSPPKAGKTTVLKEIANSVLANHDDVHLIVLLIDERPEEVSDIEDSVSAEVISSTFDEPADRHVQVAEMVLARAKRLVEHGRHVLVLLDSITRLARAYNNTEPHSGRILSGGVDANALHKPKRFFGAARSIEDGGSLTIIATALVDTGSRMDEVIFEEFKGTGNMELVLDRSIADRRVFPAIDIGRSGTRREELLLSEGELDRVYRLRNYLADLPGADALGYLKDKLHKAGTNQAFLASMARSA